MIKIIICALLILQSTTGLSQLTRIDQFGTVSKVNRPLKFDSVQDIQHLVDSIDTLSQKMKNSPTDRNVKLFKPLKSLVPTSDFGYRIHPITGELKYHTGIDYKASYEPVYNIADGKVIRAGYNNVSGNYLVIEHGLVSSVYCHLQKLYYSVGDFVQGGEIIAKSGNTGRSTGPHLHFGLKFDKYYITPNLWRFQKS